jgi:transcriptional regulator with XRE-family HTH domain
MDTLKERLQWLVNERADGSARKLSMLAHLRSPNHIGQVLRGEIRELSLDRIKAVAAAGGVRWEWLADGVEPRDLEWLTELQRDPEGYRKRLDEDFDSLTEAMRESRIEFLPEEYVDPIDQAIAATGAEPNSPQGHWMRGALESRGWRDRDGIALGAEAMRLRYEFEAMEKGRAARTRQADAEPERSEPDAMRRGKKKNDGSSRSS